MGLIELSSIGSIAPFLAIVMNPSIIETNPYLRIVYSLFGFSSSRAFIALTGLAVLAMVVVRNLVITLYARQLLRFINNSNFSLENRLLNIYLRQPYSFFLSNNAAILTKNTIEETRRMIEKCLLESMNFIRYSLVIVILVLLLLFVNAPIAIGTGLIVGGSRLMIDLFIRGRITQIGSERFANDSSRHKLVLEATQGIKEIKVPQREGYVVSEHKKKAKDAERTYTLLDTLHLIPAMIQEIALIGGMLMVFIITVLASDSFAEVVPILGIYAYTAFRLRGAFNFMFIAFTTMRGNRAAVDEVFRYIDQTSEPRENESQDILPFERSIELDRISFRYPKSKFAAIDGISLSITANTTVGFIGSTGSGKTTLGDIILGLLEINDGAIRIDGVEIDSDNMAKWQRNISYVPQDIYLKDDTIVRNVALGLPDEMINFDRARNSLGMAHLTDFIENDLPMQYDTIIGDRGVQISGGQRQRIGIARALYSESKVLIFDEATSSLDVITEIAIMDAIHTLSHRKTLIIIAHRIATLRECDAIYMISSGKIVDTGSYEELYRKNQKFRRMAGDTQ